MPIRASRQCSPRGRSRLAASARLNQPRGDLGAVLARLFHDRLAVLRGDAAPDVPDGQRETDGSCTAEGAKSSHGGSLALRAVAAVLVVVLPAAVALAVIAMAVPMLVVVTVRVAVAVALAMAVFVFVVVFVVVVVVVAVAFLAALVAVVVLGAVPRARVR